MAYNVKILLSAERFLGSSYLDGATGTAIRVTWVAGSSLMMSSIRAILRRPATLPTCQKPRAG